MTTIATYGSVSSFVGGPGQAWSIGFGWVYMAVVQVTALVLLYGIVGKKMALIARKLDAITVATSSGLATDRTRSRTCRPPSSSCSSAPP